ncbi:MAG: hypothetical protein EXR75_14310 [Myxococcales bacterium]|nr:hypothetical protein [Myxococcales bacterium]
MKHASLPAQSDSTPGQSDSPSTSQFSSLFAAGTLALVLGGCGASIQFLHEADTRFEHCMALDYADETAPAVRRQVRRACWVEWVAHYTYGQTRDRVSHAQARVAILSASDTAPIPSASTASPAQP